MDVVVQPLERPYDITKFPEYKDGSTDFKKYWDNTVKVAYEDLPFRNDGMRDTDFGSNIVWYQNITQNIEYKQSPTGKCHVCELIGWGDFKGCALSDISINAIGGCIKWVKLDTFNWSLTKTHHLDKTDNSDEFKFPQFTEGNPLYVDRLGMIFLEAELTRVVTTTISYKLYDFRINNRSISWIHPSLLSVCFDKGTVRPISVGRRTELRLLESLQIAPEEFDAQFEPGNHDLQPLFGFL